MHTYRPDWRFLTRWWVNGKPFYPKQIDGFPEESNGVVSLGKRVRLKMNFDPTKIGAKSGDKVHLQLLYCPSGWSWSFPHLERMRVIPRQETVVSKLSNRVTIVVP